MGNNFPGHSFEKEYLKTDVVNEIPQTEYHSFSSTPKSVSCSNLSQFEAATEDDVTRERSSGDLAVEGDDVRLMRKIKEALGSVDRIQLSMKRCEKKFEGDNKKEFLREIQIYNANILVLASQMLCLCELVSAEEGNPALFEEILLKYKELIKNESHRFKLAGRSEICTRILSFAIEFIHKQMLQPIYFAMNEFLGTEVTRSFRSAAHLIDELKIQDSKMVMVLEFLPHAVLFDKADLFCLDQENDERWKKLKKHATIIKIKEDDVVKRSLREFVSKVHVGIAMFEAGSKFSNAILENGAIFWGAVNYFFDRETAKDKATVFYANPDQRVAFRVWNVLDQNMIIRPLVGFLLPKIEFSKKIYIKPSFREINLNDIEQELKQGTLNKITVNQGETADQSIKTQNKGDQERDIMIRVLCHEPLTMKDEDGLLQKPKKILKSALKMATKDGAKQTEYDSLIFHIHGGGFVAMSSESHQSYTRKWANKLKIPVFSVDYRLSPDFPYPAALDDCWQAYNWVLNNCETVFSIKPKKIILAGDSAGGNLALALCLLCIKFGVRKPDGMYLSYPALNLNTKTFSPSLMLALEDQIVPYSFLKMCLESYLANPKCEPLKDPFISPMVASDELLRNLPRIRLSCGMKDPLHDEMWRFVDRILNLNGEIELKMYREMPHGALSYAMCQGMPEAEKYVEDSMTDLEELLALCENTQPAALT